MNKTKDKWVRKRTESRWDVFVPLVEVLEPNVTLLFGGSVEEVCECVGNIQ